MTGRSVGVWNIDLIFYCEICWQVYDKAAEYQSTQKRCVVAGAVHPELVFAFKNTRRVTNEWKKFWLKGVYASEYA